MINPPCQPLDRECYACKLVLPRTDFTRSSRNKDGILHMCRKCNAAHTKKFKVLSREKYLQRQKKWTSSVAGKASLIRRVTKSQLKYPEKAAAKTAVMLAVRSGNLIRQPCEACGVEKTHAHHDDYSQPLSVRWLCPKHHREHHAKTDHCISDAQRLVDRELA